MDQTMTILINEAMKIEQSHVLQATAYERTPDRTNLLWRLTLKTGILIARNLLYILL